MSCAYCFSHFDLDSKLPILLSCSHTFCKECVLLLNEILRYCPLDKTLLTYRTDTLNEEILNQLKFLCQDHNKPFIGICESCFVFICSICKENHEVCKIFLGTYSTLKSRLTNIIESSLSKCFHIIESNTKDSFIRFDDGIVWIQEHLKYLTEAIEEVDFAKKNNFSTENLNKLVSKYSNYNRIFPHRHEKEVDQEIIMKDENIFENNSFKFDILANILNEMINKSVDVNGIMKSPQTANIKTLVYFANCSINDKEYDQYFCYLKHSLTYSCTVKGFGFGRPSKPEYSIFVRCFEVQVNNQTLLKDEVFISYHLEEKIYHHYIKPINFPPGNELLLHVEIEGTGNYLFSGKGFQSVEAKGVDSQEFSESFPILYLILS